MKNKNKNNNEEKVYFFNNKKSENDEYIVKSENKKSKPASLYYISLIMLIASFSIVIIHYNNFFFSISYNSNKKSWTISNFLNILLIFAYPSIYLCIGIIFLNFNERYGLIKYFKKIIKRIIIPFIVWNIILYFYRIYYLKKILKKRRTFKYIWNLIFEFKLNSVLKAFRTFLIIFLIIPLAAYVENSNKLKIFTYCVIVLFFLQILIPYIIKLKDDTLRWPFSIDAKFIIYSFSGYIIQNYKINFIIKIIIYLIGICAFAIMFETFKYLNIEEEYLSLNIIQKYYLSPFCYIYTISVFLFIKENSYYIFKVINPYFFNKLSELAMGPFLLHIPIIDTLKKIHKFNKFGLEYRILGCLGIICFSLFITFIFRYIPLLKFLIPKLI